MCEQLTLTSLLCPLLLAASSFSPKDTTKNNYFSFSICRLSSYYIIFQMMPFSRTRVHTEESTYIDTFPLFFFKHHWITLSLFAKVAREIECYKIVCLFSTSSNGVLFASLGKTKWWQKNQSVCGRCYCLINVISVHKR